MREFPFKKIAENAPKTGDTLFFGRYPQEEDGCSLSPIVDKPVQVENKF